MGSWTLTALLRASWPVPMCDKRHGAEDARRTGLEDSQALQSAGPLEREDLRDRPPLPGPGVSRSPAPSRPVLLKCHLVGVALLCSRKQRIALRGRTTRPMCSPGAGPRAPPSSREFSPAVRPRPHPACTREPMACPLNRPSAAPQTRPDLILIFYTCGENVLPQAAPGPGGEGGSGLSPVFSAVGRAEGRREGTAGLRAVSRPHLGVAALAPGEREWAEVQATRTCALCPQSPASGGGADLLRPGSAAGGALPGPSHSHRALVSTCHREATAWETDRTPFLPGPE